MNTVASIKRKKKNLEKKEMMHHAQQAQQSKTSVNISDRVLPHTLVLDVKKHTMKLGNDTDKVVDIPVLYYLDKGQYDGEQGGEFIEEHELVNIIKELRDTIRIDKVILDNHTDFKHLSIDEVISSMEKHLEKGTSTAE